MFDMPESWLDGHLCLSVEGYVRPLQFHLLITGRQLTLSLSN